MCKIHLEREKKECECVRFGAFESRSVTIMFSLCHRSDGSQSDVVNKKENA